MGAGEKGVGSRLASSKCRNFDGVALDRRKHRTKAVRRRPALQAYSAVAAAKAGKHFPPRRLALPKLREIKQHILAVSYSR